ncbi:MAG TPA: ribonucleoside-diphosphate reductase subunit alpha [Sulfurihydrogenibium sp.]|uniref:ribonucleoside-diphosphate reductase subunit alpha n=1 Tax=Sulfurihydrogenibium sp. (strain YO3AOP1) TaxID=436114 RepID=UPI00017265E9|nr:ribonucleoside-diphosphate reductase subunit alpha [Sulfurihydrogenibium sp. YO3AOP1]ACD66079.1 ribonucleoside-diphosphate reductase, alpha subunit [Sulfurihydrogenibium sp. YO3AOP1]HBT98974.1 ribonucleoside-diphosphate reductase subunit alpha [Sulfurihydrogenibium sp.]
MNGHKNRIVVKRDGTQEKFQMKKLVDAIFALLEGLDLPDDYEIVFKITKELDLKIPEVVTTEELDYLVLKAIEHLIPTGSIYDTIATRQLLKIINRRIERRFSSFKDYINYAVNEKLLKPELLNFDIDLLESKIDYSRDNNLDYFGLSTLKDRYLTKDRNFETIEKPQWFFMRVAMGIGNTEEEILKIYDKLSNLEYLHSTPTLFNSGTLTNQYSSCYVNVVDDSLESIMDKAKETAFLAKYAGGVGTDITRIRATGSKIHSLNAKSSGIIPFIKIFDTIVNAIQQGGRRRSSQVMYLQPWHLDVEAFLDLRETTGNPYFRTPSLNTALWMPDEIMRRIKEGEPIYLFDPAECRELVTSYGEEFAKKYQECIEKAERGELELWKKIDSRDFYKKYLFKLAKTGHPWLTFKDAHNRHNPCPKYSVINSSNLCTEISIPNSPQSTAVCTLASVNLARHLKKVERETSDVKREELSPNEKNTSHLLTYSPTHSIDWDKLKDTLETMVVALDNILDKNFYPSEESRKNTMDLRPIGIGLMGFHEALIYLGIPYDSDEAIELAKEIAKFMRETVYRKSEELAKERGAFPHYYEVSKRESEKVKSEELNPNEKTPTHLLTYSPTHPYNYPPRRNAVLLAIAPTASISIIAGTSSSIDNYFSNIFSRDTLSGKFIVVNKPLMKMLEEKGIWNEEMLEKIKANQGSIQYIDELEGVVDKRLFKTAYEVSPYRQIDIAAAFQQYIDQAVSKSLYIEEDLRDDMENIYMYAWEKGLKSTYYCFIDKTIKGEKYTMNVNKRGERRGFGLARAKDQVNKDLEELERMAREKYGDEIVDKVKAGNVDACPTDPLLAKICPSCE